MGAVHIFDEDFVTFLSSVLSSLTGPPNLILQSGAIKSNECLLPMAQKSYSIMLERLVFKEDHRWIAPTFDRSADIDGEKEKCAAFLKL